MFVEEKTENVELRYLLLFGFSFSPFVLRSVDLFLYKYNRLPNISKRTTNTTHNLNKMQRHTPPLKYSLSSSSSSLYSIPILCSLAYYYINYVNEKKKREEERRREKKKKKREEEEERSC